MTPVLDALNGALGGLTSVLGGIAEGLEDNWRAAIADLAARPAALFYLLAIVVFLIFAFGPARRVAYRRGPFLTANEKAFLRALDAALGRNYRAFAQVRLADLAAVGETVRPATRRRALYGVIGKSVDFVICDALSLDPVAAIEVDDRTHLLPERRSRDAFVNGVFAEIGLPLLRIKAQGSYSAPELRRLVAMAGVIVQVQPYGAAL